MNQSELKEFLIISDRGKLSWTCDLESVKIFLNEILNLKEHWTSPGGEAKAVENDQLIVSWYGRKQSLTVREASSETIKAKLVKLVSKTPDNVDDPTLVSGEEDEASGSQKLIEATIPSLVRGFLVSSDNERENNSGEQMMEGKTSYCTRDQPRDSESIHKTDSDHPLETKIQKLELKMEESTNEFKANKLFFERATAELSGKCESTQARSQSMLNEREVAILTKENSE